MHRVVFYEITRNAMQEAVAQPRELSLDLVNAQQARRALDYLVGFNLSPLLWKKVRLGPSAGRVQSPALRMICEREEEIAAFKSRASTGRSTPQAEQDAQQFPAQADRVSAARRSSSSASRTKRAGATRCAARSTRPRPAARSPSRTSTASSASATRRRRSPPRRCSRKPRASSASAPSAPCALAQQLYEGVDFGEGAVGLITYMRTDSVNLAVEAVREIRATIAQLYGAEALPEEPRVYKTKSKNAQEAHEAIRPTSRARSRPSSSKASSTPTSSSSTR